MFSIIGIYIAA